MFGSGFKKVYTLCENSNVKVDYDIDSYGFSFIFYRGNEESADRTNLELILKMVLKDMFLVSVFKTADRNNKYTVFSSVCVISDAC